MDSNKENPSYLFFEVFSRCSNYKADSELPSFFFFFGEDLDVYSNSSSIIHWREDFQSG